MDDIKTLYVIGFLNSLAIILIGLSLMARGN